MTECHTRRRCIAPSHDPVVREAESSWFIAIMFRQISLSLEILIDAAKRSFLDNRLDSERRRKEQYAASNKKRKDMIDVSLFPSGLGRQADVCDARH